MSWQEFFVHCLADAVDRGDIRLPEAIDWLDAILGDGWRLWI